MAAAEIKLSSSQLMPHKLDLSSDRGEAFRLWKCRWEDFERLAQLSKKDKESQMAILRSCLADDTLKVVLNLALPREKRDVTKEVIAALEEHANGLDI